MDFFDYVHLRSVCILPFCPHILCLIAAVILSTQTLKHKVGLSSSSSTNARDIGRERYNLLKTLRGFRDSRFTFCHVLNLLDLFLFFLSFSLPSTHTLTLSFLWPLQCKSLIERIKTSSWEKICCHDGLPYVECRDGVERNRERERDERNKERERWYSRCILNLLKFENPSYEETKHTADICSFYLWSGNYRITVRSRDQCRRSVNIIRWTVFGCV